MTTFVQTEVYVDKDGTFKALRGSQETVFYDGSKNILTIYSAPAGAWPFLYRSSESGDFIYFTYFLSSISHKWSLDVGNNRVAGHGVHTNELEEVLSAEITNHRGAQSFNHIRKKLLLNEVNLELFNPLNMFEILESVVGKFFVSEKRDIAKIFSALQFTLAENSLAISDFKRLVSVPKGYDSEIRLVGSDRHLLLSGLSSLLDELNLDVIQSIKEKIINPLNLDSAFTFVKFSLGPFVDIPVESVEVARSLNIKSYPLDLGLLEIRLSSNLIKKHVSFSSWLNRIHLSLSFLKPQVLAFLESEASEGILKFGFGDGSVGTSKTLVFDKKIGGPEILIPDLYILAEHSKNSHFYNPSFDEFYQNFQARREIVFWRGSTTGYMGAGRVEDLVANFRVKVCKMAQDLLKGQTDVKIVSLVGVVTNAIEDAKAILNAEGILGEAVHEHEFSKYQMTLDLPGNAAAWGVYRKYLMGCLVLKPITGRELCYDHLLKPFIHFIPLNEQVTDLAEKINWVKNNPIKSVQIAYAGRIAITKFIKNLKEHTRRSLEFGFVTGAGGQP